jgi:hypothetical protein
MRQVDAASIPAVETKRLRAVAAELTEIAEQGSAL